MLQKAAMPRRGLAWCTILLPDRAGAVVVETTGLPQQDALQVQKLEPRFIHAQKRAIGKYSPRRAL